MVFGSDVLRHCYLAFYPCLQGHFSPTIREDFFLNFFRTLLKLFLVLPPSLACRKQGQRSAAAILVVGSGRKTGNSRCNAIRGSSSTCWYAIRRRRCGDFSVPQM